MENNKIYTNFKKLKNFDINKKMITGKIVLYKELTLFRTDKTGELEDGPLLKQFEEFYSDYNMRDNLNRIIMHLFGTHVNIYIHEDIFKSKLIYKGIIPSDLASQWMEKEHENIYLENDSLILLLLVKVM